MTSSCFFFFAFAIISTTCIQTALSQDTCSWQCSKTSAIGDYNTSKIVEVHINENPITLVLDKNIKIFAIINSEYVLARQLNTSLVLIGRIKSLTVLVIDYHKNTCIVIASNIDAVFQYDLTVLASVFVQATIEVQSNSSTLLKILSDVLISSSYKFSEFIVGTNSVAIESIESIFGTFFSTAANTKVVSEAFFGALIDVFISGSSAVDTQIRSILALSFRAVSITSSSVGVILYRIVEAVHSSQSLTTAAYQKLIKISTALKSNVEADVGYSLAIALESMSSKNLKITLFGVTYAIQYSFSLLSSNTFFSFEYSVIGTINKSIAIYYDAVKDVLIIYNSADNLAFAISKKLSLIIIVNVKTGGAVIISVAVSTVAVVSINEITSSVGSLDVQAQLVLYLTTKAQKQIDANGKSFKKFITSFKDGDEAFVALYPSRQAEARMVYSGLSMFFANFSFGSVLTSNSVSEKYVAYFLSIELSYNTSVTASNGFIVEIAEKISGVLFGKIGGFGSLETFLVGAVSVSGS